MTSSCSLSSLNSNKNFLSRTLALCISFWEFMFLELLKACISAKPSTLLICFITHICKMPNLPNHPLHQVSNYPNLMVIHCLNPTKYKQVVGALQYYTLTRSEIAFSVNQLCQHMHAPSTTYRTTIKRVLRNLKDSVHHGLLYSKGSLHLTAYCDSDWVGSIDDKRSTTSFAVFLGPNMISWCAKKQSIVSRSSIEVEYRALAITTAKVYWLRMLFCEIQFALTCAPAIWCDNISALTLASNPVYHARTKHIEIDYHFVRKKVINQDILIKFISTNDQHADIFTKGLSSPKISSSKVQVHGGFLPHQLAGG